MISSRHACWSSRCITSILLSGWCLLGTFLVCTQAQITLDGSLGPSGPLTGPDFVIPAEVGQTRGGNLFHSFGQFNVQTGESATFTGPSTIDNIIGRITGGDASVVDGLLRSEIPGASLFLLNPNGVMFGPNARLDVGGSFHVSTADFLRLDDGGIFHVNLSAESVLTIAPPVSFGFLEARPPAPITLEGSTLQVPNGETVSFVGGELTISGGANISPGTPSLSAPSGRIHLVSVASAGEVMMDFSEPTSMPDVASFEDLGAIQISQGSHISVSGVSSGTVVIRGGRLLVENASIVSETQGDVDGAGVAINLYIVEDAVISNNGTIEAHAFGAGRGGDIVMTAGQLTLTSGGYIDSSTRGTGPGSQVTVTATNEIIITGRGTFSSGIYSETFSGGGDAGSLMITTPNLDVTDRGIIQTSTIGAGHGGDIVVNSGRLTLADGAFIGSVTEGNGPGGGVTIATRELAMTEQGSLASLTTSVGRGGDILVEAGDVTITGGAFIVSSTRGVGAGGKVTVMASDEILIAGRNTLRSGVYSESHSEGHAGDIMITARGMAITEDALIQNRTVPGARGDTGNLFISASTLDMSERGKLEVFSAGAGKAGKTEVMVKRLTITNGASVGEVSVERGEQTGSVTITATEAIYIAGRDNAGRSSGIATAAFDRDAGSVTISAPVVEMEEGSEIITSTQGEGKGGDILFKVGRLTLTGGAQVDSSTLPGSTGSGGTVTIRATEAITITGRDHFFQFSGFFSQTNGSGLGGNIILEARNIQLTEGATISASSTGEISDTGNAGTIRITATDTFLSEDSAITTKAIQAQGGNIQVTAQNMVRIRNSQITTEVAGGDEKAGNITIDPDFVIVEDSQIITRAVGGPGGNINITAAEAVLIDPTSVVDATSVENIDGEIDIQAPVTNLSSNISPLPQIFLSAQLRSQCAERWRGGEVSRLVESGRDGLPAQPGSLLPSLLIETAQRQAEGVASHGTHVALSADFSRTRLESACAKWETR